LPARPVREEVEHRACALLREALIEIVAADAVRVAFDLEYEAGMREDDAGNFCQFFARCGLERVAARVEENIGHVHDQAASGILRLQYRVQLPEKLCAKFRFFRFCSGGGRPSLVRVFFCPCGVCGGFYGLCLGQPFCSSAAC